MRRRVFGKGIMRSMRGNHKRIRGESARFREIVKLMGRGKGKGG